MEQRSRSIEVLHTSAWDDLVSGADAELFLSRSWMRCLAAVFDLRFESVAEFDGDDLSGAVPFVHVEDIRGERLVSLPFSDFAPPLTDDHDQWVRLADRLIEYEVPFRISAPTDSVIARDERFKVENSAVRQSVPLDAEFDELAARMAVQPRRHGRRAEREGIVFRLAENRAELRAFYDLHLGVRKYRHGLLCQPFELFEALWDEFVVAGNGGLMLGFDGDTVAGGCLLLCAGDTIYYKYAASHPDYRSKGVSHGAVLAAIEHGLRTGHRHLDLGRSDLDQLGLIDFKRRFGATAVPLARFTFTPDLYQAPDVSSAEMVQRLSELFTSPDVSDPVTEQAGNLLYRLFA